MRRGGGAGGGGVVGSGSSGAGQGGGGAGSGGLGSVGARAVAVTGASAISGAGGGGAGGTASTASCWRAARAAASAATASCSTYQTPPPSTAHAAMPASASVRGPSGSCPPRIVAGCQPRSAGARNKARMSSLSSAGCAGCMSPSGAGTAWIACGRKLGVPFAPPAAPASDSDSDGRCTDSAASSTRTGTDASPGRRCWASR